MIAMYCWLLKKLGEAVWDKLPTASKIPEIFIGVKLYTKYTCTNL